MTLLRIFCGYLEPIHDMACGRYLAWLWMGWIGKGRALTIPDRVLLVLET